MEDKNQNHTVNNSGVTIPPHDFAGLAEVIEKAKPSLPDTGNGFVPLKDFDPKKPYEDMARHLKDWDERLQRSPLQPEARLSELKAEKDCLAQKHETQIERRLDTESENFKARLEEEREHHRVLMERAARDHDECRQRLSSAEAKRDLLQDERRNDLTGFYENRIQELIGFQREVKDELSGQILDLKAREQALKGRIDYLENERGAWLDERRNWLETRERQFDLEKTEQRNAFVHLRKRVVDSEHPNEETLKSIWQTASSKSIFKTLGIAALSILAFILLAGWCIGLGVLCKAHHPQVVTLQNNPEKIPENSANVSVSVKTSNEIKTSTNNQPEQEKP